MKAPEESNTWIRWFWVSATKTLPSASVATPLGCESGSAFAAAGKVSATVASVASAVTARRCRADRLSEPRIGAERLCIQSLMSVRGAGAIIGLPSVLRSSAHGAERRSM
jgi:hypothetical protein